MPKSPEEMKFAVIVAVTDYKAFRDGILNDEERKGLKVSPKGYETATLDGKTAYFIDRKGYAVLTPDEATAVAYTKKSAAGLDTKISKQQTARLLAGDLGVYLSMDVVNKDYAEQIKAAKEAIDDALKAAEDGVAKNQRAAMIAVRSLIGPIFQAVEDSKGVLFTIEFRPTAFVLHVQSELRANSKTSALLKTLTPLPAAELDRLPAGHVFYTGMMMNADIYKMLGPISVGAMTEPGSKAAKSLEAAFAELAKAGPGATIGVAGLPASGVQAVQYAEPAKALAAQRKILESLGKGATFGGGMLIEQTPLKKNAGKYKNLEFDSLTLKWDLEQMAASSAGGMELGDETRARKLVEGSQEDTRKARVQPFGLAAADDKHLISVTAAHCKAATALLDSYFSGADAIGKQKGYQEARKELPSGATLVGLVDIVAYGTAIADIAKPIIAGIGVTLPDKFPAKLPKGDRSFVAASATLDERHIGFDLVITASAVRDMYKAFAVPFLGGF